MLKCLKEKNCNNKNKERKRLTVFLKEFGIWLKFDLKKKWMKQKIQNKIFKTKYWK